MNINFDNIGGIHLNQDTFLEIQKICTDHFACKNCPVYENDGLHNNNSVTICQKVADKIIKEQRNGNNSM